MEDASAAEEWMIKQSEMLGRKYNRSEFSLEEGEQMLRELDEINELIKKYHSILMTLTERSSQISPLWQRGERIQRPIPIVALADYIVKDIVIREGEKYNFYISRFIMRYTISSHRFAFCYLSILLRLSC